MLDRVRGDALKGTLSFAVWYLAMHSSIGGVQTLRPIKLQQNETYSLAARDEARQGEGQSKEGCVNNRKAWKVCYWPRYVDCSVHVVIHCIKVSEIHGHGSLL